MLRGTHLTLLVMLLGGLSLTTAANSAETRRDNFGDWGYVCSKADNEEVEESCNLFQTALLNNQGNGQSEADGQQQQQRLLLTRIGYLGETSRPMLLVTAPLGILLPPGISVSVDGIDEPVRFAVQRCDAGGCLGHTPMTDELIEAFRKGSKAEVTFQDPQRREIPVPLSLKGFTKGLAELNASRK